MMFARFASLGFLFLLELASPVSGKKALVLIDVQDCFLEGGSLAVEASHIIPVINKLREEKDCHFDLVVRSQDFHPAGHISFASANGIPAWPVGAPIEMMCTKPTSGKTTDAACCPTGEGIEDMAMKDAVLAARAAMEAENPACKKCTEEPESCFKTGQSMWPDHCLMDGDSTFPSTLTSTKETDKVVQKGSNKWVDAYSAFMDNTKSLKTELDQVLKDAGITEVYVAGIATDFCVSWSAHDAVDLGYTTYMIEDASAGIGIPVPSNLLETIKGSADHTILAAIVEKVEGAADAVATGTDLTILAPTDAAFKEFFATLGTTPEQVLSQPMNGEILLYHVVGAMLKGEDVKDGMELETLSEKQKIKIHLHDGVVTITSPPSPLNCGDESPVTFTETSKVVQGDVTASNGIIHVIDRVLVPPSRATELLAHSGGFPIWDLACSQKDYSTLAGGAKAAMLKATLNGDGLLTVMAPGNGAFEKAFKAFGVTAEQALKEWPVDAILKYHVVAKKVDGKDVTDGMEVETVQGEKFTVKWLKNGDGPFIEGGDCVPMAKVVQADVPATNGVVHLIDSVLIPPTVCAALKGGGKEEAATSTTAAPDPATSEKASDTDQAAGKATVASLVVFFLVGMRLLLA